MAPKHILLLEDDPNDAVLIERALRDGDMHFTMHVVRNRQEFVEALKNHPIDLVLSDNSASDLTGLGALRLARDENVIAPLVLVSGTTEPERALEVQQQGVWDLVPKNQLWRLSASVRLALKSAELERENRRLRRYNLSMQRLVRAVQELSLTHDLDSVMKIVRHAARELNGADGATFILRDGDQCYYADEDAISPLWKGRRFPMTQCISGWAMLNRQPAVIEDIYLDPRIPHDAYRPTFVKSLVMVPIRTRDPIGAIGNYWAKPHRPATEEVELIQALANTTSVAMENITLYSELEQRVRDRTHDLSLANHDLETFSYSVSHDLRAPLRQVEGLVALLASDHQPRLNPAGQNLVERILSSTKKMGRLIDDLLKFSRLGRQALHYEIIDMTALVSNVYQDQAVSAAKPIRFQCGSLPPASGDTKLIRQVWVNLLSNAIKFSANRPQPTITVSGQVTDKEILFQIEDNGTGFGKDGADKLFGVFQRLHSAEDFPGTGVGLAIVHRIITRHGGRVWAESELNQGARFFFTLPATAPRPLPLE